MDSFLKNTLLSKLTEDEVENMNRLLSINSIKFIKKNPLTKQTSDRSWGPIPDQLSQNIEGWMLGIAMTYNEVSFEVIFCFFFTAFWKTVAPQFQAHLEHTLFFSQFGKLEHYHFNAFAHFGGFFIYLSYFCFPKAYFGHMVSFQKFKRLP